MFLLGVTITMSFVVSIPLKQMMTACAGYTAVTLPVLYRQACSCAVYGTVSAHTCKMYSLYLYTGTVTTPSHEKSEAIEANWLQERSRQSLLQFMH